MGGDKHHNRERIKRKDRLRGIWGCMESFVAEVAFTTDSSALLRFGYVRITPIWKHLAFVSTLGYSNFQRSLFTNISRILIFKKKFMAIRIYKFKPPHLP